MEVPCLLSIPRKWKVENMTKKAPSCSGSSVRKAGEEEDTRRSTRLRLKTVSNPKKKLHGQNIPKKPPTAFFYFLEDFRKQYKLQNPEVKSMREIGKTCGDKWKTMTYEEKVKYYDIATEKREEFHRAMIEYTKRMESGEYDESETDSDFSE